MSGWQTKKQVAMIKPILKSKVKGWEDMLQILYAREGFELKNVESLTARMKQQWPGDYIVEEYYDASKHRFNVRLVFEDPKQETMWRLKNSA